MPQLVAEIEHAAAVVARQQLAVLVEIGDVGHVEGQPTLAILHDMTAGDALDLAEIAAEGELLLVGDRLVVEYQDGVAVHGSLDRRRLLGGERLAQIDAVDLADEDRMDLPNGDAHLS